MSSKPNVNEWYSFALNHYDRYAVTASNISYSLGGRIVEPKLRWASIIFCKMVGQGISLLQLLPHSRISKHSVDNWDFPSVASLARNIIECYQTLFYLCFDEVSEDEWKCRMELFNLHDCISRMKMLSYFGSTDSEQNAFKQEADKLRIRLNGNSFFLSLKENRREELLKGQKAFLINRDEIEAKYRDNVSHYTGFYKFLSSQIHTFPLSFYRIDERRGRGLENDIDKSYISMSLEFISQYFLRAANEMLDLNPHILEKLDDRTKQLLKQPFQLHEDFAKQKRG